MITRLASFLSCFVLLVLAQSASAASLQVSPVRLEMTSGTSTTLWLSNSSDKPIDVQVRVYNWTQENGQDLTTLANDVIATPAITRIAPNSRQLVRVVLRTPRPTSEQAYRLLVEELPPAEPVLLQPGMPSLNLLLAYSVPLFVGPAPSSPPQLSATYASGKLTITNSGAVRAQLSDLTAKLPNGQEKLLAAGLLGYVLAGKQMSFDVDVPQPASLEVSVNQKPRIDLPLL